MRSNGVKYPNIWLEFEGKERNGKKNKYWVQDLTEEHFEEVVKVLLEGFIADEPLCQFLKIQEDADALLEIKELYLFVLKQKYGLICFTKGEDGMNKLVGFNCTGRTFKGQPTFKCKTEKVKIFLKIEDKYIPGYKEELAKLNIDDYLTAIGLYVSPDFRGESIGLQILNAREPLCKALGIKYTVTLFTSIASQKLAIKGGYVDLMHENFTKYTPKNEEERALNDMANSFKFMYKRFG